MSILPYLGCGERLTLIIRQYAFEERKRYTSYTRQIARALKIGGASLSQGATKRRQPVELQAPDMDRMDFKLPRYLRDRWPWLPASQGDIPIEREHLMCDECIKQLPKIWSPNARVENLSRTDEHCL